MTALLLLLASGWASSPQAEPATPLPLEEIRRFAAVFRAVERDFVDGVDRQALMRAAIRGMLSELDPYSEYLEGEALEELAEDSRGDYVGVGLELVRREDGRVGVLATIDGGPASRADVRAGDLIAAIDGEAIAAGTAIGEVIARLRGPPGSEVGLTLEREGRDGLLMVRLKRERIRVGSVRAEPLGEDVLYLRVAQFHEGTAGEIRRALERRLGSGGRSLAGLVLDLRQNPGGLLHVAVEVADLFLEAGVVVRLVGRHAGQSAEFSAGPGDLLAGVPIAVLIDGGTASAAEIVAAALRDRGRARLIGEPSFGKGSVQTIVPLSEREAIKLTTARLHAPGGQVLDGSGLEPDLRVAGGGPAATDPSRDAVVRAALAWLRGLRPGTGAAAAASRGSGPRAGRGG